MNRRLAGGLLAPAALGLALTVGMARPCLACDCSGGLVDPRMAQAGAGAAFRGTVVAIAEPPWWERWRFEATLGLARQFGWDLPVRFPPAGMARLRVEAVWKGSLPVEVEVADGPGSCAVPFALGASFVVFADERDGRLETSVCHGTVGAGRNNRFQGAPRALGPATPVAPVPAASSVPDPSA